MAMSKFDRNYGVGGRRGAAVREMPCITTGGSAVPWGVLEWCSCWGKPEAAHATARGAGGVNGDAGDLYPACNLHHRQQSVIGIPAFNALYGVDVAAKSAEVKQELDDRFGPEPCWKCDGIGGHSPMCPTMEALRERREDEQ